jgi:hypothetical protein
MSGQSHSHVGPFLILMELKLVKIGREWIDGLNLRSDGATREKWSIFGWEGRGVVCGYSELQGGSPHLCRLRTVHSKP